MSTQIESRSIGTLESDGQTVAIDLEALRESRLIITGNSGAGKSRTLRRLIEQIHGAIQQIVFDPEDEFFTLREQLDFILVGGEDADFPIRPGSAVALAKQAIELNLSMVIGLHALQLVERFAFVGDFIRTLIEMPKEKRRPIMIVVDEADMYAPEGCESATPGKTPRGDAGLAMVDLAIRGRKRGLVMVIATNRVSLVSATVRAPCVSKLVGRQSMDIDVDRSAKDLGLREKKLLRQLAAGMFFATGPAFGLNSSVECVHVGDVITTHPKAGSHAPAPPPPRAEVAKILAKLVADLDQGEVEAVPVERLGPCTECARLKEVNAGLHEDWNTAEDARQSLAARLAAEREGLSNYLLYLDGLSEVAIPPGAPRITACEQRQSVKRGPEIFGQNGQSGSETRPLAEPLIATDAPAAGLEVDDQEENSPFSELSEMERIMLTAIAQSDKSGLTKAQVLVVTGYRSSGHVSKAFARLQRGELVETSNGLLRVTANGRRKLGNFKPLPVGKALLTSLLNSDKLTEMQLRMLKAIADVNPKSLGKGQCLEICGYSSSGHTSKTFAKLKRWGYIVPVQGGGVRLADDLQ